MSTVDFPHRPGITDDFLAKAGVTVLLNPERLHIPYHSIDGAPTGHYRDRFKIAVTGADGKPQRNSQPFESGMAAYIPPFHLVKGEDLFVTEGEFKALALTEAGFNAVALPGLYCYAEQEILPGLRDAIELDRQQFISAPTPTRYSIWTFTDQLHFWPIRCRTPRFA
jgi:Domain of unknown function (DUF3854)